jgi:hypothetical protein
MLERHRPLAPRARAAAGGGAAGAAWPDVHGTSCGLDREPHMFEHTFDGMGVSEGRSQRMLRTTIGPDDAATVGELLRELGQGVGTPEELRDAAIYWSAAIDPDMECADLQTIAWLLRDASAQRRVPTAKRDRARYWAAYLEGRMAS